ncbi:DUF4439 domain-containing protein [Cellulomonas sp. PhB143]|uniref:DUF4439 domain-containing protein n=1 Tax=Cellulomonas sp. PhB143 TaxID=2485186 RepID=UPI0011CE1CC0|nr:DUF4439 domain-containing protein [Cellulomonas sp. PhB143]
MAALVAVVALGGCGVRVDTPPPAEPSPGPHEVIRSSAVTDALQVEQLARTLGDEIASGDAPGAADGEAALLGQIADFASQHVAQLGGVYRSGLPGSAGAAPGETSTSATGTPDVADVDAGDVLDALAGASVRGRAGADSTRDGALARLLASVSTSQIVSAGRLADLVGARMPATIVPGDPALPEKTPAGLAAADLATLVASEDASGYTYEVEAARSTGSTRTRAVRLAAAHRDRAEGWARLVDVAGGAQDPRRVAYQIEGTSAKKTGRGLESSLATTYATLVGEAAPVHRAALVDLMAEATRDAGTWGAAQLPFPGMPERAAD